MEKEFPVEDQSLPLSNPLQNLLNVHRPLMVYPLERYNLETPILMRYMFRFLHQELENENMVLSNNLLAFLFFFFMVDIPSGLFFDNFF